MLLQPRPSRAKRSFKKFRKGRIRQTISKHGGPLHSDYSKSALKYGTYGLIATMGGRLSARQLEAARRTVTRSLKRTGKLWVRTFPQRPITAKASGIRMGKGKGGISHWVAVVKPGTVIMEVSGVPQEKAFLAFKAASKKIAIDTNQVSRFLPLPAY